MNTIFAKVTDAEREAIIFQVCCASEWLGLLDEFSIVANRNLLDLPFPILFPLVHWLGNGQRWIPKSATSGQSSGRPFLHMPHQRMGDGYGRQWRKGVLLLFHARE